MTEAVLLHRQEPMPRQVAGSPEPRPKNLLSASQGVKPHLLIIVSNSANTPYLSDTVGYKCRWQYLAHVRYHLPGVQKEFVDARKPRFVLHDEHLIKSASEPKRIGAKKDLDLLCSRHEIPIFNYLKFEDEFGLLIKRGEFEGELEKALKELKLIR